MPHTLNTHPTDGDEDRDRDFWGKSRTGTWMWDEDWDRDQFMSESRSYTLGAWLLTASQVANMQLAI